MSRSRLLIVEPTPFDGPLLMAAARSHDVDVFIAGSTLPSEAENAGRWLTIDFTADTTTLVRKLTHWMRHHSITGVVTTAEYLTPLVALVAAQRGLPGNDPTLAISARNKAQLAHTLHAAGVTHPATLVFATPDAVRTFLEGTDISWPLVVKPAAAAGSAGVSIVHTASEISAAIASLRATSDPYRRESDRQVLVQRHVRGREYSVESIVYQGLATHVAITAKHLSTVGDVVEVGHDVPATLSSSIAATITNEAAKAIAACGIRNGAAHTELIIDSDGIAHVVELGARIGGGRIATLVSLALGIDLYAAMVHVALGHPPKVTPARHRYASVRFVQSAGVGVIERIKGMPSPSSSVPIVEITKPAGTTITATGSNSSRVAHFIVVGDTPKAADRADQLAARTRCVVTHHERTRT